MSQDDQTNAQQHGSEGRQLFEALSRVAPSAPTACAGWTAHDLAAHLAAGAKELGDLVEERIEGKPEQSDSGVR